MKIVKQTDHNGKPVKTYNGTNVRVSQKVYNDISKYAKKKGYKIGMFFEMAALEKMAKEK